MVSERVKSNLRFLTLSFLNIVAPRARWVAQLFEERRQSLRAEKNAREAINEFRNRCESLGIPVTSLSSEVKNSLIKEILDKDYHPTPENVYPLVAPYYFSDEPSERVDALTTVALCDAIDEEENSADKHPLKKAVERGLSDYEFTAIKREERDILRAFENCIIDKKELSEGDIFVGELDREDSEVVEKLLKDYTVDAYARFILADKEQVDEMRSTLAHLIREGRLSIGNLTRDVIQEKLREVEEELEM
ncbi:MAG: hypothetical protein ABEJ72_00570, partial [Candidatus Aenigmatarchaeota archaeon]